MVTARFWVANRITPRSVDLLFRVTSAAILTSASRLRFIYGGIGPRELASTLRRVHGLRGWSVSWAHTARKYLSAARLARLAGRRSEAAAHEASAALCFHFAQVFEHEDIDRKRHLYHRAASLFRAAGPELDPPATHVEIPWRDISLPGYLRLPPGPSRARPVVVFLNGASTVKEETALWSTPFLERGFATLALDTPGSGEAWDRARGHPEHEDIAAALVEFGNQHPGLDPRRVALLGISLRGAMAVQLAAANSDVAAAISVTGPFHPASYFRHLNGLVRQEISFLSGAAPEELESMVDAMSLIDVAPRLRAPLLVIGASNDLVVPPEESLRLYQAAGGPKHLLFLDRANHVGFSHMGEWTARTADWLAETLGD